MPKPDRNRLESGASINPEKPRAGCDSQPGYLWGGSEVPRHSYSAQQL